MATLSLKSAHQEKIDRTSMEFTVYLTKETYGKWTTNIDRKNNRFECYIIITRKNVAYGRTDGLTDTQTNLET